MRIYDIVIDPDREDHIARHGVIPDEVREVIAGNFLVERTRWERLLLIGQTCAGRYLALVVVPNDLGNYSLITARDADESERHWYHRRWKGR